jgi:hypothetical protein
VCARYELYRMDRGWPRSLKTKWTAFWNSLYCEQKEDGRWLVSTIQPETRHNDCSTS